jgi:putative ABC transport system ATP-binding protein
MISVAEIVFRYSDSGFQLTIPSLTIEKGEQVAVVGPSGTGKTTLINLLAGILMPESGNISIDDVTLSDFAAEDRQDFRILKMGLIFQEFELLDYLSVLDNVLLPYRINPILQLHESVIARARVLIEDVGLADKLSRKPSRLSQGERQRVAVCRALLTEPDMLLGDEPTGNLDPKNRDHIMDILFDYSQTRKAPLIVVTHDSELIGRFGRTVDIQEMS